MEDLIFEFPSKEKKAIVLEFMKEFKDNNSAMDGTSDLDKAESYESWIEQINNEHAEINITEGRVPSTTYLVIRKKDNKLIGMINLRHRLNDFLKKTYWGHIGFCVRPNERRRGYATRMLQMSLEELKKMGISSAILGCHEDNVGSMNAVLRNNGEKIGESEDAGKKILGFEIKLGDKD